MTAIIFHASNALVLCFQEYILHGECVWLALCYMYLCMTLCVCFLKYLMCHIMFIKRSTGSPPVLSSRRADVYGITFPRYVTELSATYSGCYAWLSKNRDQQFMGVVYQISISTVDHKVVVNMVSVI